VPHRAGAAGGAADHALRPRLLVSCHRAAPGEGCRASFTLDAVRQHLQRQGLFHLQLLAAIPSLIILAVAVSQNTWGPSLTLYDYDSLPISVCLRRR
jgi:hypothetical protein